MNDVEKATVSQGGHVIQWQKDEKTNGNLPLSANHSIRNTSMHHHIVVCGLKILKLVQRRAEQEPFRNMVIDILHE